MFAALGFVAGLISGASALPPTPCAGAAPPAGTLLHGPALHIIDGHTICIAQGPGASTWVAVRLSDVPASTAWGTLMAAAFAQTLDCRVEAPGEAQCAIGGRPLGEIVREPAVKAAGQQWRRHAPDGARTVVCDAGSDRAAD